MAKPKNEEQAASLVEVVPESIAAKEEAGTPLVTILYSLGRDLYRLPAIDKPCWLSVKVYPMPAAELPADQLYLGAAITADGRGWRKAYSKAWRGIVGGDHATLPVDDPMVVDYLNFK
jgi:hypothetical protein